MLPPDFARKGRLPLFWDGQRLIGAHLSADDPGELDEPFDVEEVFPAIEENVADWFANPRFTRRPNLLRWQQDAPPSESGGS